MKHMNKTILPIIVFIAIFALALISAWREERAYQERFRHEKLSVMINSRQFVFTMDDIRKPRVVDPDIDISIQVVKR